MSLAPGAGEAMGGNGYNTGLHGECDGKLPASMGLAYFCRARVPVSGGGDDGSRRRSQVGSGCERARDESYPQSRVTGSATRAEESQREVYRRRRVMYDLQSVPRAAQTEMILVVYDGRSASYECRIFYKSRGRWGSWSS